MTFQAPFLSYADVGVYANNFLNQYHPSLDLPVPIEYIIEFHLSLYIHPLPNMYRIFKQSGWLSQDGKVIFVDEYQQDNYWEKYRFTLAHEVGHYIMHKSVYDGPLFDSEEECILFFRTRDRRQVHWYEQQADWFAGHVLVPTEHLDRLCVALLIENRDQFETDKMLSSEFWSFAASELAPVFQVNHIVVKIRIDRENLAIKHKTFYLDC